MSRRDLLRRGAVVGGTLLWTVPVIATLSRAHETATTSPAFVCCWCHAAEKGVTPPKKCMPTSIDTAGQCLDACTELGYRASQFHNSPSPITCDDDNGCSSPH